MLGFRDLKDLIISFDFTNYDRGPSKDQNMLSYLFPFIRNPS